MRFFLVVLLSAVAVDARVSFDKSEVLDNVDLKGANGAASFRCSAGCRVFSPTKSDTIVIVDGGDNKQKSLRELSETKNGLELAGGTYKLKNTGLADPPFVFYSVEKGAANYNSPVFYVNSAEPFILEATAVGPVTILSSTGAVSFSLFSGFPAGFLPTVYATGFDSTGSCKPVFTPGSVGTLAHTFFPVNSPIATIDFKKAGAGLSVNVAGDTTPSSMGQDSSAVYVSPGYFGCPNIASVGDSLYTLTPKIAGLNDYISLTNSNGLSIATNADYSIASLNDAVDLEVDIDGVNDLIKLSGKDSFSQSSDAKKLTVKVAWTRKDGSKDGFALQIDIASNGGSPGPAPKTTKLPAAGATASGSSFDTTTKSSDAFTTLISCLVTYISIAIR